MAEGIIAAYKEAHAQGGQRGREELGIGTVQDGGEEVPQRVVMREEGLNYAEDVVQPLT